MTVFPGIRAALRRYWSVLPAWQRYTGMTVWLLCLVAVGVTGFHWPTSLGRDGLLVLMAGHGALVTFGICVFVGGAAAVRGRAILLKRTHRHEKEWASKAAGAVCVLLVLLGALLSGGMAKVLLMNDLPDLMSGPRTERVEVQKVSEERTRSSTRLELTLRGRDETYEVTVYSSDERIWPELKALRGHERDVTLYTRAGVLVSW